MNMPSKRKGEMMRRLRALAFGVSALIVLALPGCSWSDLVDTDLPPDAVDLEVLKSGDGAVSVFRGALYVFRRAFGGSNMGYVVISGRLSDELSTGAYFREDLQATANHYDEIDKRAMEEDNVLRSVAVESWYRNFNLARNQAADAIYYLRNFGTQQPVDLIGHMYAVRGMTMIFLAEIFCSGIPLSEYGSPSGHIYKPGSTTEEVFTLAVAQFDSALANLPDSVRLQHFAKVGKARALLNLGRFEEAAAAVADVPTNFQYKALFAMDREGSHANNWTWHVRANSNTENDVGTVADREGGNGLPFVSANDPRVPLIPAPTQNTNYPNTTYMLPAWMFPNDATWGGTGTEPKNGEDIVMANGIEARLIEAEAAVNRGDASFLQILNTLRTTCTDVATCPDPAPAGTGGVAGLPPLTDPGTKEARIKMVYDERAYWLFLTGHRQGDLRRLVRVYGWPQNQVYPTGDYPKGPITSYGSYTNIPLPHSERVTNPKYTGCFNRDA